ncbi:MAG: phycobiliprotein lyase [Cyanobacteria bacterium P01_D01_bin.123]
MDLTEFQAFFDACVGSWSTERTYHYLSHGEVERSHTDFQIEPISSDRKARVLSDNAQPAPSDLDILCGYHLHFDTVSDKGERVSQSLNILFVPKDGEVNSVGTYIDGLYLRDRAYEEARPVVSDFRFNTQTRELLMTTHYTRVVSVDSITLVNPNLRVRKILNYRRPQAEKPLSEVILIGFGVEQKTV